jgi:hypothetical protein
MVRCSLRRAVMVAAALAVVYYVVMMGLGDKPAQAPDPAGAGREEKREDTPAAAPLDHEQQKQSLLGRGVQQPSKFTFPASRQTPRPALDPMMGKTVPQVGFVKRGK